MEMTSNMPVARTEMLRHYTLNIKLTDEPHLSPLADHVPSDHVTFFPQLFIVFLFHFLKKWTFNLYKREFNVQTVQWMFLKESLAIR